MCRQLGKSLCRRYGWIAGGKRVVLQKTCGGNFAEKKD